MHELTKHRVQRWFQRKGIRIESARHAKFSFDACNFRASRPADPSIILDVGANIGQTSIWFSNCFPKARIYAFEPFAIVFKRLREQVRARSSVVCVNCALGANDGRLEVSRLKDPLYQCGQVRAATPDVEETEGILMRTVDSFCRERDIRRVFILKTDTEGYDLEVLRGARDMLRSGRVTNVLSEASIIGDDHQHTNLFAMMDFLQPFSFELHGIYDLHHSREEGRLEYFNALFRLKSG
jgi:FkbM family methyltransferase